MKKKFGLALAMLLVATALASCGEASTATSVPPAVATTSAAATTTSAAAATTSAAATTGTTGGPISSIPALAALPAGAKKGGTLTLAVAGPLPPTLPGNGSTGDVIGNYLAISPLLWSTGLVEYDYNSLHWYLSMAKDLKVDDTGKIYTFTLRPDLKWSDGSPISVDDFQNTFDNIAQPNAKNPTAQYALLQNLATLASYKTDPAASTVTVTFKDVFAPDVAFYYLSFAPVPKKTWGGKPFFDPSNNPEIKKPTVVSGPFKIDSYDPNGQAVLSANENWYKGRANFDKIVLKSFAPNLVYEAIKTGQADASLTFLPPAQYNEVKTNADIKTYDFYGVQVDFRYIVYNTTKAPFNDMVLRQAIIYALDRNTMIKLGESDRAKPQYTFVNQNSPFFNPDINHYDYSLDTAKKMLSGAGYTYQGTTLLGKDGQPLKFGLDYDSNDLPGKLLATYVQAQLKQLGVDVTVTGKDSQTYLIELLTKKYDAGLGLTGGSVFPDPDASKFFYTKDGVFNTAGYVVPRIDEIFATGAHELDPAKRIKLYQEAQKILNNDSPSAVFYAQVSYIAANKKVGGIAPSKGSRIALNDALASWYFNQ